MWVGIRFVLVEPQVDHGVGRSGIKDASTLRSGLAEIFGLEAREVMAPRRDVMEFLLTSTVAGLGLPPTRRGERSGGAETRIFRLVSGRCLSLYLI
jgi:hypothetical protein